MFSLSQQPVIIVSRPRTYLPSLLFQYTHREEEEEDVYYIYIAPVCVYLCMCSRSRYLYCGMIRKNKEREGVTERTKITRGARTGPPDYVSSFADPCLVLTCHTPPRPFGTLLGCLSRVEITQWFRKFGRALQKNLVHAPVMPVGLK